MKIAVGILIGFLIMVLLGGLVLVTGTFNTAATAPIGRVEDKVATLALNRSVKRRAKEMPNPIASPPQALRAGLSHFRANCLPCHGAPGVEEAEFAQGLNPPAPDLTTAKVQARPDGQLYWIVSEGIRMTGMPAFSGTHSREEIWHIVAFLRRLPELTEEEQGMLAGEGGEAGHHGGAMTAAPTQTEGAQAPKSAPHKH